jgi:hypothetical protein
MKRPTTKKARANKSPASTRAKKAKPAPTSDLVVRLEDEPWVQLADNSTLKNWTKNDEIRYNQGNRQAEKYDMFRKAFDFLNENEIKGDYHEYGCHRCRTFRMALTEARRHNIADMKFWAFDSFEGLPDPTTETSVSKWIAGALTTSERQFHDLVKAHGVYPERVNTVKGFYDKSLTKALQQKMKTKDNKIALVTVDCDLYESAVPVFKFIEPLLQEGSVIYMDDLFVGTKGSPKRGVARAFLEFQKRSKWKFIRHMDVSWWGRTYIAVKDAPNGVL